MPGEGPTDPSERITKTLLANRAEFLRFLERRVGSRELAEDILQEAFVKSVSRGETVRDEESAVAWFYRMLRNAITDHFRRDAASKRKLEGFAAELDTHAQDTPTHAAVCQCVARLAETLPEDYARAIARIEVDGVAVKEYATEAGISPSNAAVRVFRAREALRKQVKRACGACAEHGCLDCTCKEHAHGPELS